MTFNSRRRIFGIVDDMLHIAAAGDIRSHYGWFSNEGWLKDEISFDRIVRGFSIDDDHGERLVAYRGHDMSHACVKEPLIKHLAALREQLALTDTCEIFVGASDQSAKAIIGKQSIGLLGRVLARYASRTTFLSASG